jgi:hypothetical protein
MLNYMLTITAKTLQYLTLHNSYFILCDYVRRDNLPAVDVKTWYLHAHMFDGDIAAGPVPLLFAANPDVAAASIAADQNKNNYTNFSNINNQIPAGREKAYPASEGRGTFQATTTARSLS